VRIVLHLDGLAERHRRRAQGSRALGHKIAIGDSDLINVRFAPVISTDRRNTF
jgi:hypothetical protein